MQSRRSTGGPAIPLPSIRRTTRTPREIPRAGRVDAAHGPVVCPSQFTVVRHRAFIPPTAWEGETVARFAFLHPHTPFVQVRQILDRMA